MGTACSATVTVRWPDASLSETVYEVSANQQLGLAIRQRPYGVGVPDFLKEGLSHETTGSVGVEKPRRSQGGAKKSKQSLRDLHDLRGFHNY